MMKNLIDYALRVGWLWKPINEGREYLIWPPPSDYRNSWSYIGQRVSDDRFVPHWFAREINKEMLGDGNED